MIVDLNDVPADQRFEADVCVVGAGAAGVVLARQLMRQGNTVCLLEAGGFDFEADTQDLFRGENRGMSYYDLVDSRLRFFGGTTNIWGGRCALLDPVDFRRRTWVPHSGWPIDASDLEPYYQLVHEELGLGEVCYDDRLWSEIGEAAPAFDPERFATRFWRFDDLKERFSAQRSDDVLRSDKVQVLLHANLTHIQATANAASVEHVKVQSLQGVSALVSARHFVLAGGGIENARMLLVSNDVEANGIGNRHDQVGRYFMEHPHGRAGKLTGDGAYALWAAFRKRFRNGKPDLAPVLVPSEVAQEREGILNTALTLKAQRNPERGVPLSRQAYQSLKHSMAPTRRGRGLWHFYRAARNIPARTLRPSVGWARNKLGLAGIYFMIRAEQAPNPDSRVTLSPERDALGVARADLRWQLSAIDKHTIRSLVDMLDAELSRLGIGTVHGSAWLEDPGNEWPVDGTVGNHPIGGYHHMGATRMAEDPRTGVVDGNCKVHGYSNLHIAGSSVFATAGWANPTLTILALAQRLGDHLHKALP
ncbi:MAG: GMC family oxidoreductase [Gammaproteobacteria bacterium]|nr:GMC family oxidoreductase [Gammaproteobacteria bacterium]